MHILIIPSWYPSIQNPISGIFFKEQVHALRRYGHQVGVVAVNQLPAKQLPWRFEIGRRLEKLSSNQDKSICVHQAIVSNFFPKVPYGISTISKTIGERMFTSYIKTEGIPDILHAHSALNGGLIATKMGKKYKIPVVITEHSSAFARNLLSSWQKKLARQVFEESDMNIVVSQSLGEDLKKLYGTSIEPCQVIPNMLGSTFEDFEFFSGNKNNQKFCFTSIGSLDPNKAHIDLVKAFHQAFSGNKEVELLIVGTGKISEQIEDYIRENSTLNGRIKLLGDLTRQEVRDTILYSDVYVHSSHYETFGVVLIEALACGKPVISTACGGPNDIVNDKNGILVPVGNINALAASMIYMQKHLHRYNSDSIRSDCVAKYSSGVIVDKLINVYEQLAYF